MAKGINKVILVGHLGQPPDMKATQSGEPVCVLSVATSESWTDKESGQKQERTEWHRVIAFKRLAEICGQYLDKGSQIYCEGQLRTRKWQDQQGQDRYTTEIVISEMQMLGVKPSGDQANYIHPLQPQERPNSQQSQSQAPSQPQQTYQAPANNKAAQSNYRNVPHAAPPPSPHLDQFDDDIPF